MTGKEIEPLFVADLVDIARAVHEEQKQQRQQENPGARVEAEERFLAHLSQRGYHVDYDLWEAARELLRCALGAPKTYYLFAFPYPDMVVTALALEGRSGDGSNLALDFQDQREVDYPEGTCVPGCSAEPGCGHSHKIIDAYAVAGRLANWLEQVLLAAGSLAIETAMPPAAETPEKG